MGNGILAQAAARLPSSMTASAPSGAQRNVPASFTGGQGQSLGIFQPPKKRRGGGGGKGLRLKKPKKPLIKGLQDDWKKVKAQLQENVAKGLISPEQAATIESKLAPLYQELNDNYGQPYSYSQDLKDAISKYGNLRDGVDYETVVQMRQNPTNLVTGKPNPAHESNYAYNQEGWQTPEQAGIAAKERALAEGNWSKAEELGASSSEIIARGGILVGTDTRQEGPETYTVNLWETSENFVPGADVGHGGFTTDAFYGDSAPSDADWDDPFGTGSFEAGSSYDEVPAYSYGANDDPFSYSNVGSYDSIGYYDAGGGYETDAGASYEGSSYDEAGVFNRGGVIRRQGGGGVPVADPRSFPGEPMGTDRVPVWAEDGEYVVTREGTKKFKPLLDKINAYRPPTGTIDGAMSQMDDLINKYSQGGKVR